MQLRPVATFETIDPADFKKNYYDTCTPVVIKNLAKEWPAYTKWNWDYFKSLVGDKRVPLYNNVKSDAYTPINKADDYKTFGEYIDMIRQGPAGWRIFLFNIFDHAPQLINDFTWPEHMMKGFVKKYPMVFTGGATSITHMHFDIDLSHILHTQFAGRKRVLMFPFKEQHKLYRKPFEVLSLADFSHYYQQNGTPDYEKFPALKLAEGFDFILEPGDTLFMPDFGTARCDFPGGDAHALYRSVRRLLALPGETRMFLCHDYLPPARRQYRWETTVATQRAENIHIRDGVEEEAFVRLRRERDATLEVPRLLLPSVQVNIRAGALPPAESNGNRYLKIPLNVL